MQQGELSMVCVGLSERDLKHFGGGTGGARQNFGEAVAPSGTPLAPPLHGTQCNDPSVNIATTA